MPTALLPDGRQIQFEDGTPDDVMDRVVKRELVTSNLAASAPKPEKHPKGGFLGGAAAFVEGMVPEAIRHPSMLKDVPGAISDLTASHPIGGGALVPSDILTQIGTDAVNSASTASEDQFSKGNLPGGIVAAIPGVGPAAAQAGEEIGRGDTAVGLGHGAALLTSALAPSILERAQSAGAAAKATEGMSGLGTLPTNTERINANLGLKPKHYKGGYQPAEGVLRQGIEDTGTSADVLGRVDSRMTDLTSTKAGIVQRPGVAANEADILKADDIFQPVMEDAHAMGQKNLVRKIATTRASLLDSLGTGADITAETLQNTIDRTDRFIKLSTGEANQPLRIALQQYRKALTEKMIDFAPDLKPINQDIRDLIPAKQALKEKMQAEAASTGPRQPLTSAEGNPLSSLDLAAMIPGKIGWIARAIKRVAP